MRKRWMTFGTVVAAWMLASSCTPYLPLRDGESLVEVARSQGRELNPVIVIPGILGSRLVDSAHDRVAWGAYGMGAIRHGSASGRRSLAIPMEPGVPLNELRDSVHSDGALRRLQLLPGVNLKAYDRLLGALSIGGFRPTDTPFPPDDEHLSCFEFGYDWRRSIAENAAALDAFIKEKRELIHADQRRRSGTTKPVKFDIIGHSMGGLVARYYLMYGRESLPADGSQPVVTWAGKRHVRQVIQVGAPNLGSAVALMQGRDGVKLFWLFPKFQAAVIGTLPSVYELFPRMVDQPVLDADGEVLDIYDPKVWARRGWGLMDPRQDRYLQQLLPEVDDPAERRDIAYDHLTKCLRNAKAIHRALDCPCRPPSDVGLHTFFGHATPTPLRLKDEKNEFETVEEVPGDGTVAAYSAAAEPRDGSASSIQWSSKHSINAPHMMLPIQPEFIREMLPLLLGEEIIQPSTENKPAKR